MAFQHSEWRRYLCLVCYFAQVHVTPASLRPVRQERTPNTGIHGDIALILLVQIIRGQHLCESPQIIALVLSVDKSNIARFWQQLIGIRLAIEDEEKVRGIVQRMGDVELEVLPCEFRLEVCVENQRAIGDVVCLIGVGCLVCESWIFRRRGFRDGNRSNVLVGAA